MNGRGLLLLLISGGLALAALIARKGELLALSVPFLSFILVALTRSPGKLALSAARTVGKSDAPVHGVIQVELALTNQGDTLANVRIHDALPASGQLIQGRATETCWLSVGATAGLDYSLTVPRGIYSWKSVSAVAADPLGLFETSAEVRAPGEIIIQPKPLGIGSLRYRPRRTLHSTGPVPVPLAGSGTDFLGIREYRSGDALRRINWRLTARHPGRLFTNEHERHEVGNFGLILDARQADAEVFEGAVTAAASLAESILKDGNRLSLLVFGRSMAAAFPGYGKRQLSLILQSLSGANPSAHVPLDYLQYFPARLFPTQAVLVMISSPVPHDFEMYARLRAAGYEMLLFSPDSVSFAARRNKGKPDTRLGIRAALIERRATLLSLSRLGVHIVDWQLHTPIQAALDALAPHLVHRSTLLS
ncbi:MAG TPA: DUF58 domain-containing protein [Anaerolineales bacterium]|nr:DUF58 domain-containing protein [Anaerolineales bacterium]